MIKRKLINLLLVVLITVISGCGAWDNFTTYFNVYYNATDHFDKALEEVEKEKKKEKELFQFRQKPVTNLAKQSFDKVIEKCSNILQFSNESSFVDDALYMIGVAYYYKQNYSRALRKFRELEAIPESDLLLKNKLWIAKTELQLRNYDLGLEILEEVKIEVKEQEEEELVNETYLFQITLLSFRENYLRAIDICNEFLEYSDSDEEKAKVAFQLGILNYGLNKYEEAAKAFLNVKNYSPEYEVEFLSKKEYAAIQTELGNYDDALKSLEDMKFDDKFLVNIDVLELELGKLHQLRGEFNLAEDSFLEIDTVYAESEIIKEARYSYAMLLENDFRDYDSSMFYYQKANRSRGKTNNNSANNLFKDEKQEEITNNIKDRIKVLDNYFKLGDQIRRYERQLQYIDDPTIFVQDSIDYHFEKTRYDSLQSRSRRGRLSDTEKQELRELTQSTTGTTKAFTKIRPAFPTVSKDTVNIWLNQTRYDLGNAFIVDLNYPDSAFYYYDLVLNEDSVFAFTPNVELALASYYSLIGDQQAANDIYNSLYSQFQGSEIALQAGKRLGLISSDAEVATKDTTEVFYVEAENKYLLGNLETALHEFYALAERNPDSYFAPKALYTAGWIWEVDYKNFDSAAVVYDTLVARYATSEYAKKVKRKLIGYKRENTKIVDSLATNNEASKVAPAETKNQTEKVQENKPVAPKNDLKKRLNEERAIDELPEKVILDSLETETKNDALKQKSKKARRLELMREEKETKIPAPKPEQVDTAKTDSTKKTSLK